MNLFAFAVTTARETWTPTRHAEDVGREPVFVCTFCGDVVRSNEDANHFPYCCSICAALADADNQEDR